VTVFKSTTELYDHFRKTAQLYDCNPCFDSVQEKIERMNEKGMLCLCKIGTKCPCDDLEDELVRDDKCYCEIFRRVL
jgi:hypothetical protein